MKRLVTTICCILVMLLMAAPAIARDINSVALDSMAIFGGDYSKYQQTWLGSDGKTHTSPTSAYGLHLRIGGFPGSATERGTRIGVETELDLSLRDTPKVSGDPSEKKLQGRIGINVPLRIRVWSSPGVGAIVPFVGVEYARGGMWWTSSSNKAFVFGLRAIGEWASIPWELEYRLIPAVWADAPDGLAEGNLFDLSEHRLHFALALGSFGIGVKAVRTLLDVAGTAAVNFQVVGLVQWRFSGK